jgi:surface polysaccharide O-acyltransferase-like enzyme
MFNKSQLVSENSSGRMINLETLRLISIIMVISLHYLGHGKVLANLEFPSANYFIFWFIESASYVSVNIFVLISGYFMVESQAKVKKLVRLYLQILFYSIGIYILFLLLGLQEVSLIDVAYYVFPVTTNRYWFATSFLLLYIMTPLLNITLNTLKKSEFEKVLLGSLILFSFLPNLIFFHNVFNISDGYNFIWFIVLYILAGYIKKYYTPNGQKIKWIISFISIIILMVISRILISFLSKIILGYSIGENLFYAYNSILVVSASVISSSIPLGSSITTPLAPIDIIISDIAS